MGKSAPGTAKFTQVAAEIRRRIEAGAYPSGELPSIGVLAQDFDVSVKTMQRAIAELDAAGVTAGGQGRPRVVREAVAGTGSFPERVAAALRADIASGGLTPGGRLPGEMELAAEYGVSRATVRAALAQMEASGEVERRAGRRYVAGVGESDLAYERIAADLRKAVKSGRYPDGRLPGENALAASHDASRPTVRKALELLQADGIVYSAPKQGWFVTATAMTERTP